MANQMTVAQNNIAKMKAIIASDNVKTRMHNMLGKEAGTFIASVLDLYTGDTNLTNCDAARGCPACRSSRR